MLSLANPMTRINRQNKCLPVKAGNKHFWLTGARDQRTVDHILYFHWSMADGGLMFPAAKIYVGYLENVATSHAAGSLS